MDSNEMLEAAKDYAHRMAMFAHRPMVAFFDGPGALVLMRRNAAHDDAVVLRVRPRTPARGLLRFLSAPGAWHVERASQQDWNAAVERMAPVMQAAPIIMEAA